MRPVSLAGRSIGILLAAFVLGTVGLLVVRERDGNAATIAAPPATPLVPTPTPLQVAAEMLAGLAPDDLVLQLAYEPTFSSPEEFQPFGRLPVLTVFADGRTIYVDGTGPRRAMDGHVTAAERATLLQQIYDLGFGRLQSWASQCRLDAQGNGECTADSSYSVIRAQLPDGTLREVRNYHTYANDSVALAAIRERLNGFQPPAPTQLYRPERATLFLGPVYGDDSAVAYRPWPLAPARLQPPTSQQTTWAIVLSPDEWDALIEATGPDLGARFVELNGRRYTAYLMPWLPNVDYSAEVAAYGDPLPTTVPPAQPRASQERQ